MLVFGYAKDYKYDAASCLWIQVRIPSIHGPYLQKGSGVNPKQYITDIDLPWYRSMYLPYNPAEGQVVVLASMNDAVSDFLVIGVTGASYGSGFIIEAK